MNISTKEIAEIKNISSRGVELARYRLRKKLELNKKENLVGFLMRI
ncbi:helix-turn-helix transcriptional regulator [Flavobacterium granuli]|nr:LuxR C-terminal-related transcriptional regulator [Flavobacterium granuli]